MLFSLFIRCFYCIISEKFKNIKSILSQSDADRDWTTVVGFFLYWSEDAPCRKLASHHCGNKFIFHSSHNNIMFTK